MNTEAELGIGFGVIAVVAVGGYLIYDHFANPPANSATSNANSDINQWLSLFYNESTMQPNQDPNACKLVLNDPAFQSAQQLSADIDDTKANWFENVTSTWGAGIHGFFWNGLIKGEQESSSGTSTEDMQKQALHTLKSMIDVEVETCNQWAGGVLQNNADESYSELLNIMETNWEAGKSSPYFLQSDIDLSAKNHNLTASAIAQLNAFCVYFNSRLVAKGPPAPEYKNAAFKQLSDKLLKMARQFDGDTSAAKSQPNGIYTPLRCYMILIEAQKLNASDAAKLQLLQGVAALCGSATGPLRGADDLKTGQMRALYEFEDDARDLISAWGHAGAVPSATPYGEYTIYKCLFLPMGPATTLGYTDWGDLTRRILYFQATVGWATNETAWQRFKGTSLPDWDTDKDIDGSGYWMPPVSYKNTYGVWDPNKKTPT